MLTSTYKLSMQPGTPPLIVRVSQYDKGESLVFRLTNSATSADISSGVSAEIRGTKPDGNGFSYAATYSYSNSVATVTVTVQEQMTAIAGSVICEIILTKGSGSSEKQLGTANFILEVERAALDKDTVKSASSIRQLINVIDRTDELIAAANNTESAVASMQALANTANSAAQEAIAAKNDALAAVNTFDEHVEAAELTIDHTKDTNVAAVIAARDLSISNLNAVKEAAEISVEATKENAIEMINEALEAIIEANSTASVESNAALQKANNAISIATIALTKANNVENDSADVAYMVDELKQQIEELENKLSLKFDDVYLQDGYQYFEGDGVTLKGPIGPFAGGGGGGGGSSGNNAKFEASNTSGWITKTISNGANCYSQITWSSVEEEIPTGDGILSIYSGGSARASMTVSQGVVNIDLSPYCNVGTNRLTMNISDIYGNNRSFNATITVVELSLSSTFDPTVPYNSAISFPYTPIGSVFKTIYFIMDGTQIGTYSTNGSGRQQSFTVPAQDHGAHIFRVYFEATINNEAVRSNELYYEIIFTEAGESDPIITSTFRETTVEQYTPLHIPYIVYNPDSMVSNVTIKVNDSTVATLTNVDRTSHTFDYRPNDVGTDTVDIICGSTTKSFTFTVTESTIDVEAVTDQLKLYLSSAGRSNDESPVERSAWTSGNVSAVFTGFNWSSDGWQRDSEGSSVMRVSGDARIAIPYEIFRTDARSTGRTIEIDFATSVVMDYDTTILSCLSGGRGIKITPQLVELKSEQSSISTQFKEDEHERISFVIEKAAENRLVHCYINGIDSGVIQYPVDDDFSQTTPVGISIGSNYAVIDLYCIRVYDNSLTRSQILDNWIADSTTIETMLDRYTRNNIYDDYYNITIANLPSYIPYLVFQSGDLPQYKGDKKTIGGYYINPLDSTKNFTFTGAQIDVQGTSSQYYYRKNYKVKFKNGFDLSSGVNVAKYNFIAGDIPISTFCFKADVASSEGANNVELVRLYNASCPYKTPAQVADPRVKQGIDGFPIVIFVDDGETISFLGKYNFNADKSAEEFFGFGVDDESWETLNNTSDRVLWKSADYSNSDWLNDFEARYPDQDPPYANPAQLKEFAEWIVQTDRTGATGDALDEAVTYDTGESDGNGDPIVKTYEYDTQEYRLMKFRNEIGDYVELQSSLFYYIFTEMFLMVDSRAKNSFPSPMGTSIE